MANDCQSCKFIVEATSECRRYPPTAILEGLNIRSVWPIVSNDDYCGEFQVGTGGTVTITLTSLTPNTLPAGSTPATIDVIGTGFDSTCEVYVDGTARSTFYISPTDLQYTARPDQATSGTTSQVSVANDVSTSNTLPFTFT